MQSVVVAVSAALASGVEFVEALTIVLAVGLTRGWRVAFQGTAAAAAALVFLVVLLGLGLLRFVPLSALQLVIGVLLLVFGLKWLRKAILRFSGLKSMRDEASEFANETQRLRDASADGERDWFGLSTAFNGVFLEGTEVVFIVLGFGAAGSQMPAATIGAAAAAVIVIALGVAVHRPLVQVPENLVKFVVGIMLTTFGTIWTGEGLGVHWWHGDASIAVIIVANLLLSAALITWLRSQASHQVASQRGRAA
jgi:uncharacterized membrane protein